MEVDFEVQPASKEVETTKNEGMLVQNETVNEWKEGIILRHETWDIDIDIDMRHRELIMKVRERKMSTSSKDEGTIADNEDIKVRILNLFYKQLLMAHPGL